MRFPLALSLALMMPALALGQSNSARAPDEAPRGAPVDAVPSAPNRPLVAPGARDVPIPQASVGPAAPSSSRQAPPSSDDGSQPMRFEIVREGPADACGSRCRRWVMASGRITPDTMREFRTFSEGRDLSGMVVVLDSNGGSVGSGLELGRSFRRLEMTTTVGKTTILPGAGEPRATLGPRGTCASMCAFVLLGGVRRHVPSEARVLVHQIWPSAKRDDATAASYTAENLVSLQRSLGALARYTTEMGGEIELFELSMRIPPWERMRALTADEMRRIRLRNSDNPFEAQMAAMAPVAMPPADGPTRASLPPASTSGWSLTERDGGRVLARRHPLTIEGEEIGSFELVLTCGNAPDSYAVRYNETRRASDSKDALRRIIVAAGKDRVAMAIRSSSASAGNLQTTALGTVSSELMRALAEGGARALVVATETAANVRTVIQVGNTGIGAALPQLAAGCKR